MKPFTLPDYARELIGSYPSCASLKSFIERARGEEIRPFIRLWMREGIPYAFQHCPFLYQTCREWLGNEIQVNPNQIALVGSGKFGYSLKSTEFRGFSEKSDLDLLIVSASKFDACVAASELFISDFENGRLQPKGPAMEAEWKGDIAYIKQNLPHGFVQSGMVPLLFKYEATQKLEDALDRLTNKLKATPNFPKFTKASYRVYRDESALERRLIMNLRHGLSSSARNGH